MSCDPSPLEKILERTFARVVELEKQLTHKTAELKDTRTTLEAVHAVLGRALRSSRNDSEVCTTLFDDFRASFLTLPTTRTMSAPIPRIGT